MGTQNTMNTMNTQNTMDTQNPQNTMDTVESNLYQSFLKEYSIHVPSSHRTPIPSPFYEERFRFLQQHQQATKIRVLSLRQSEKSATKLPETDVQASPNQTERLQGFPPKKTGTVKTAIEIIAPFSRFTVSNIIDYFEEQNLRIECIVHCVFAVSRDSMMGQLQKIERANRSENRENWIYIESNLPNPRKQEQVENDLKKITEQLHLVVHDFQTMRSQILSLSFPESESDQQLTQWIGENLILLGTLAKRIDADSNKEPQMFGLFRQQGESIRKLRENALQILPTILDSLQVIRFLEAGIRIELAFRKHILLICFRGSKTSLILAGYFAPRAEISWKKEIPKINTLMNEIYSNLGLTSFSHFSHQIDRIAQQLPVLLFFSRAYMFHAWFQKIVERIYSNQIDVVYLEDQKTNSLWMLTFIPQEVYEYIPLYHLRELLRFQKVHIEYEFSMEINHLVITWYNLKWDKDNTQLINLLEKNRENFLFSWQDRFQQIFAKEHSAHNTTSGSQHQLQQQLELQLREQGSYYLSTLSQDYPQQCKPEEALQDIHVFENWPKNTAFQSHIRLENHKASHIRIYSPTIPNVMQLISVLANYGFHIDELNHLEIHLKQITGYVIVFGLRDQEYKLEIADSKRIAQSINYTLNHHIVEAEAINALILKIPIKHRELILIKTWVAYLTQIDKSNTKESLCNFLLEQPAFAQTLLQYFHFKHCPNCKSDSVSQKEWQETLDEALEALPASGAYKIASNYLQLMQAIVRTNYYRHDHKDKMTKPEQLKQSEQMNVEIGIKVLPKKIPSLQNQMALFDLFVYSHDWEGIHIRADRIARGGIRWSDRMDDYRTEVFNLMRAQTNKNTIIVPSGSKGGFVVKQRKTDLTQEQWLAAGKNAYQRFMRVMLHLTDNRDRMGNVIPASNGGVKRLDDDDSYLVVAADKGTGNFSDLANEISLEMGYWLKDAFASGGSQGYNHKEQGITAKGAWVSFLRHAKDKKIPLNGRPITVVGIGDMSGDVFGNGILIHSNLHLVGAFNHLYIFFDPVVKTEAEDIQKCYEERKRLFTMRKNWHEYNPQLISAGGGVFSRQNPHIKLTTTSQEILETKKILVSGEELIQLLLTAPVDLLWNGGIGTYVKSSKESHYQAQDVVNDRVRVDASALRVKVIAEGGNLGLTPIARVEAARGGVALNADFIDNSAGVNMSDHEVNLKILLDLLVDRGRIDWEKRNQLIKEFSIEQIGLVLQYNKDINLAISLEAHRTQQQLIAFRSLIKFLNRDGYFIRGEDAIPFESEIDELQKQNKGLERPVVCTLLCYTKLYLHKMLEDSLFYLDTPLYTPYLYDYFPERLAAEHSESIEHHPLKKEIIIAELVNELVHTAGMTYFPTLSLRSNKSYQEIAHTYLTLSHFLNLKELREKPKWKNREEYIEVYYQFLLLLADQIFYLNQIVLEENGIMEVCKHENRDSFQRIWNECLTNYSYLLTFEQYNLSDINKLEEPEIMADFALIEVIEDAFHIFTLQQLFGIAISTQEYYAISDRFHLRAMRKIIANLPASNDWDVMFTSRIEKLRRTFLYTYMKRKARSKDLDDELVQIIRSVTAKQETVVISASTLYETLAYLNTKLS